MIKQNKNLVKITSCDIHIHFLLFIDRKEATMQTYLDTWKQAASGFKSQTIFGYIDIDLPESEGLLGFFEIKKELVPTYRLLFTNDMSRHAPIKEESGIDVANITKFVRLFLERSLTSNIEENNEIDLNSILYEIKTNDDLRSLRKDFDFIVLGLFKDSNGQNANEFNEFVKYQSLKEARFAVSSEKKIFTELKIREDDAILVIKRQHKASPAVISRFKGKFELDKIKK